MGQIRFHAPRPEKLAAHAVERAYLAGMEAIPWCSRNTWSDGFLAVERAANESGCLYIPWDVDGLGSRVLSTCNLMDRERPYCLPIEVARGTLHRARSLAVELEGRDVAIPSETRNELKAAMAGFLAACASRECAYEPAGTVIRRACMAIQTLVRLDWGEGLSQRHRRESRFATLLAGRLDSWPVPDQAVDAFTDAFNAACIPFRWRDIQPAEGQFEWQRVDQQVAWCRERGLQILGGPLLQLDQQNLPDWVLSQDDDFQIFENAALHFIDRVTKRFAGQVTSWCCAGRLNIAGTTPFCEEQKLRLAVTSIEAVRQAVPDTPVVISFDQPWAEYLVTDDFDLSPLHFADALVRADLGLAGVGLEMNFGYWPGGTLPRDLLEVSRHIDRWSQLGIPLILQLTLPSSDRPDPLARGSAQVVTWTGDQGPGPASHQRDMEDLLPLLLTKPALHGIIWGQLSDQVPHELPHAGLLDASGQPKPLLSRIASLRRTHLS